MAMMSVLATRKNEPPAINLDAFTDEEIIYASDEAPWRIGLREGATSKGASSVTIQIPLKDGRVIILETTRALWGTVETIFQGTEQRWKESPL